MAVFATDQAISLSLLNLANCAYIGLSWKVTSIGHASVLLGNKRLGEIVIMAGTSDLLGKRLKGYGMESGALWRHSLAVAIGSRLVAGDKAPEIQNNGFMAGLIHDAGKIMMDQYIYESRRLFQACIREGQKTIPEAEKQVLGFDHAEIGSEVCKIWGIPGVLTEAVKYHHCPSRSQGNTLAHVIHVADSMANMSGIGACADGVPYQLDGTTMECLELEEGYVAETASKMVKFVEGIAASVLLA